MGVRALLAGVGVAVAVGPAAAQIREPGRFPAAPLSPAAPFSPIAPPRAPAAPVGIPAPVAPATPPRTPAAPFGVPTPLGPSAPFTPPAPVAPFTPALPVAPPAAVAPPTQLSALPRPENAAPMDAGLLTARRGGGGWQVALGPRVFRELGEDEGGAKDIVRTLRELRPTEWAAIGTGRPVVEYGLANGRPLTVGGFPRSAAAIDLRTVRLDAVRGVWVVRDDAAIHFNFGLHRADAEQAVAVIRRYGFNRVGLLGSNPAAPAMTYLFAALDGDGATVAAAHPLAAAVQEQTLARVGIPVPGVGYVGEAVRIDPRRLDVRREGSEWVLASGAEVLGRFGPAEYAAREAARTVQEGRYTEFCRAGGVTFFLANGKAPARVPFSAVGRRFDPAGLRAAAYGNRWAVTEAGRHLFDAADQAEADGLIRLVRHFGFDTVCQLGNPPRAGITFLAKGR
jgi:hypothetical protein